MRTQFNELRNRLRESRRFIQALIGPRQVGKTTILRTIVNEQPSRTIYASADEPSVKGGIWIEQQWERGRQLALRDSEPTACLILDEVTKITGWSEVVKRLWDEDTFNGSNLHVVICGSSSLLLSLGLSESLAGRFERILVPHWSFQEMHSAFGFTLEQYLYYGGYPAAAELTDSIDRWRDYIKNSLIETVLARDILQLERIHKPALLRNLFELGCQHSGQELSLTKAAGVLEAGNTTTLSHYLTLLEGTFLLTGLKKYSGSTTAVRATTPKFLVYNTALMSAFRTDSIERLVENDPVAYGRYVECAVGAHVLSHAMHGKSKLYYWRESQLEVDFVVTCGDTILAIEVKSGNKSRSLKGLDAFCKRYNKAKPIIIGANGLPIEEFLKTPLDHYF